MNKIDRNRLRRRSMLGGTYTGSIWPIRVLCHFRALDSSTAAYVPSQVLWFGLRVVRLTAYSEKEV